MDKNKIEEIKQEALNNKVPIMEDEGIEYVKEYLKQQNVTSLLEVGCAVGYSSIVFASTCPQLRIVTLEKDESRYNKAIENINYVGLQDRITPILTDALTYQTDEKFECLFLDGPKSHNQKLLERYENNLVDNGIIIVDDVYFHGMVDNPELIYTRRLKSLVSKLKKFRDDMLENKAYDSKYLEIGDGILICHKRR